MLVFFIEFAHSLVTEWVRWQQRLVHDVGESPPMPAEQSVNPEERPKFDSNLDYETHSESPQPKPDAAKAHDTANTAHKSSVAKLSDPSQHASPPHNTAVRRSRQQRRENDTRSSYSKTISEQPASSEQAFRLMPQGQIQQIG